MTAHIFILGAEDELSQAMRLKMAWYWDPGRTLVSIPVKARMPKAKGEHFAPYALALRAIRQSANQSSSSGGLVCVTRKGRLTAAIDLQTFQEVVLQREKELTLSQRQAPAHAPVRTLKRPGQTR